MNRNTKLLLWIVAGVLLLAGGGVTVYQMTRGVRNKNPGNIEKGTAWQGLDAAATAAESRFAVFTDAIWGFRALARVLLNYSKSYGLNTVKGIINRYAPSSENDTGAYVNAVASRLNVGPDAPINVTAMLPQLLDAIARHENAGYAYPPSVIAQGIALERSA
jgi:hypothetical protein